MSLELLALDCKFAAASSRYLFCANYISSIMIT